MQLVAHHLRSNLCRHPKSSAEGVSFFVAEQPKASPFGRGGSRRLTERATKLREAQYHDAEGCMNYFGKGVTFSI
jgi:hypothetical protein